MVREEVEVALLARQWFCTGFCVCDILSRVGLYMHRMEQCVLIARCFDLFLSCVGTLGAAARPHSVCVVYCLLKQCRVVPWIHCVRLLCPWNLFLIFDLRRVGPVKKTRQVSLLLVCFILIRLIFVFALNEKINLGVFACFCLVIGRLQLRTITFADPFEATMSPPDILFGTSWSSPVVARSCWFCQDYLASSAALVLSFVVSIHVLVTTRAHIAFYNLYATQMFLRVGSHFEFKFFVAARACWLVRLGGFALLPELVGFNYVLATRRATQIVFLCLAQAVH